MPIMEEPTEAPRMRISPSAPLELMWILHNLQAKHVLGGPYSSLEPLRAGLKERLTSFWADGVRGFTETIVISERSATTLDLDLHDFFARLDEAVEMRGGMPSLLTERPSERTALEGRLRRLREDPELRERYRALLLSVWEPVRPEWEAIGRAAVVAAAADWDRRLSEGAHHHPQLDRPGLLPAR